MLSKLTAHILTKAKMSWNYKESSYNFFLICHIRLIRQYQPLLRKQAHKQGYTGLLFMVLLNVIFWVSLKKARKFYL